MTDTDLAVSATGVSVLVAPEVWVVTR